MFFAVFVVVDLATAENVGEGIGVEVEAVVLRGAVFDGQFEGVQRDAGIAIGMMGDGGQRRFVGGDMQGRKGLRMVQRAIEQLHDFGIRQGFEDEDAAAREQRAVDFKGGVFRGRANQDDAAFFDVGQEGVLLGFVEAVDFVDEDDGFFAALPLAFGVFHDFFNVFDAAHDCAEGDEARAGLVGDDLRQGSFAHAGRPPEDHGAQFVVRNHVLQDFAFAQQLPLPDKVVEGARAQAGGQRLVFFVSRGEKGGLFHWF